MLNISTLLYIFARILKFSLVGDLSPIFLRIQIQLMRLLVGLLVGQLLPSFYTHAILSFPRSFLDVNHHNIKN